MLRRLLALALLAPLLPACRSDGAAHPPRAEFLVAAGDSTFWVHTGADGARERGSPLQLAHYGGRFYEVYVVDDDRSYGDAEIIGQQLWRRDLVSGDSALLFRDTTIAGIDRWYGRTHPDDHPLDDDEDDPDSPRVSATSELDILGEFGPYLSYEYHADFTVTGGDEWHLARRGVLDLRHGGDASLPALFGDRNARYLERRGATLFDQALDSVLASHDARAREAVSALGDFAFDRTSFALVADDRAPAVEFVAPGRGSRGGGLVLQLPPIGVATPAWWDEVRRRLPEHTDSLGAHWRHARYELIARGTADDDSSSLTMVDSSGHHWTVAAFPAAAQRVYWLDSAATDSTTLRALGRAFDEAALYSDDARTAMRTGPPSPSATTAHGSFVAQRTFRPLHHVAHIRRARHASPERRPVR